MLSGQQHARIGGRDEGSAEAEAAPEEAAPEDAEGTPRRQEGEENL